MSKWIMPAGRARRAALTVGVLVVVALGIAMLVGWNPFDFGPAQSEDFTKPSAETWEDQKARWAAEAEESVAAARERRLEADAGMSERVNRLVAEMNDVDPATRERADVALRNLPVNAAPLVEAAYEKERETLEPEPRARIERSVAMFRTLAAIEKRRQQRTEWVRKALLVAYNEVGERNPKWDEAARRVLALSVEPEWDDGHAAAIAAALREAAAAGCDDPLVMFEQVKLDNTYPSSDEGRIVRDAMKVADAMTRSEYPFWVKVDVMTRCASLVEELERDMFEMAKTRMPFLKSGAADVFLHSADPEDAEGMPEALLHDVARFAYWAYADRNEQWMSRFQEIDRHYQRLARPGSAYVPLLKGTCHLNSAQEYPMSLGSEKDVEEWTARRQVYLGVAEESLKRAHEIAPENPVVALQMLKLYVARGDDAQAEQWFRRAMSLYPDYREACQVKLRSLGGDEGLEFGRELLRQQNWRGQLPFILVDAHAERAEWSGEKETYFEGPGVWEDIRAVYSGYLELFPKHVYLRSEYARYANRCRQWAEADRQFKILGDAPAMRVFGSMTSYDYHRKKAARNAAAQAGAAAVN